MPNTIDCVPFLVASFERDPDKVLNDVVNQYVSIEQAESQYGVVIRFGGNPNDLVRLPGDFSIDAEATRALRNS